MVLRYSLRFRRLATTRPGSRDGLETGSDWGVARGYPATNNRATYASQRNSGQRPLKPIRLPFGMSISNKSRPGARKFLLTAVRLRGWNESR